MTGIENIFGGERLSFEEFAAAARDAGISVEGNADREAELVRQLEAEREKHREELAGVRAKSALREELLRGGAYNPTLAIRAVDPSDMTGDDEQLRSAAAEKIKRLRASEPYLFRGAETTAVTTGLAHAGARLDEDDLSDSEYYAKRMAKH